MMSDTGLYINWIPNTLNSDDEDEEEVEPTLENDTPVGKWGLSFIFRAYFVG